MLPEKGIRFIEGRSDRFRGVAACWLALAILLLLGACRSVPALPPLDTAEPGWTVMQGQAVWHPPRRRVDLAGELLVATNVDGRSLIEFVKTPLSLVHARTTSSGWQIHFASGRSRFAGHGPAPVRFLWLQLPRAWRGEAGGGHWRFLRESDARWRLESLDTDESIAGYLAPIP